MKTFDNSREGNDCWIAEKWIWCDEPRCVVRVIHRSGEQSPYAACFVRPSLDMPDVVFEWFNGGPSDD